MRTLNPRFRSIHLAAGSHGAGVDEGLQLGLNDKHTADIEGQAKHANQHRQAHAN
jgi:hypothetical protein